MEVSRTERRAVFILADEIGANGLCDLLPPLLNALQEHVSCNSEHTRHLKQAWSRAKQQAEQEADEGLLNDHFGDESMGD